MDVALIVLAVFSVLLTVTALSAAVAGIRRAQVTGEARRALTDHDQPFSEVLWQVREVSESPHLRFIASRDISNTDLALIKLEETLAALPPGHRELARLQGVELSNARAVRASVVDNLVALPQTSDRELAAGIADGLVRGMSGRELPSGHQHLRKALTSGNSRTVEVRPQRTGTSLVDQTLDQVLGWLNQFGATERTPSGSSVLAQLADAGVGLANELLGRARSGASPEAQRLLGAMEDLGERVTPAYLWQVTEYSETALHNATAAVHRMELELTPRHRGEKFRRTWWPSVGDRVAEDALAHGRRVLAQEHLAHRQLRTAMEQLSTAEPHVRGTVWALLLRDVPPGAIDGPDLRASMPALDAYLSSRRGRR